MVIRTKLFTSADPMNIRIGNGDASYLDNNICTTTTVEPNEYRYYFCDNGVMFGRLIYIHKLDIKDQLKYKYKYTCIHFDKKKKLSKTN